jgi:hypothetical protein
MVYKLWNAWFVYVLRMLVRDTYESLPGPRWVKIMLVVVCLAIPGPQDELLLLAVVAACRWFRNRKR